VRRRELIAMGFIESYAHPGGTATGNVLNAAGGEEALITKRISLFKELVPGMGVQPTPFGMAVVEATVA
jgi:hypothetical protein